MQEQILVGCCVPEYSWVPMHAPRLNLQKLKHATSKSVSADAHEHNQSAGMPLKQPSRRLRRQPLQGTSPI